MSADATTKYLGKINCTMPTCGQPVPLFESKKGLAHFTCNECGCQVFSRNNRADRILRSLLIQAKPASSNAAPAVTTAAPAQKPAAAPTTTTKSANDGKAQPVPKPAADTGKRGLFGRS